MTRAVVSPFNCANLNICTLPQIVLEFLQKGIAFLTEMTLLQHSGKSVNDASRTEEQNKSEKAIIGSEEKYNVSKSDKYWIEQVNWVLFLLRKQRNWAHHKRSTKKGREKRAYTCHRVTVCTENHPKNDRRGEVKKRRNEEEEKKKKFLSTCFNLIFTQIRKCGSVWWCCTIPVVFVQYSRFPTHNLDAHTHAHTQCVHKR